MENLTLAQAVEESGFTEEEVNKGYIVCGIEGYADGEWLDVIQRIDSLYGTNYCSFASDTEAGEQAARDGLYLFTSDKPELRGLFILDTPANRLLVDKYDWASV